MTYPIVNITCGRCGKNWHGDDNGCFKPICACDKTPSVHLGEEIEEQSTPHTCPVCQGRGFVLQGFYDNYSGLSWFTYSYTQMCRSCEGTGIVWD